MVCADAVLRKLPGALGHAESAVEESFSEALGGLPEYPHYTRPAEFRGWAVPGRPARRATTRRSAAGASSRRASAAPARATAERRRGAR